MKPPLKWVGGKTKLLPELRKRMPLMWGRYFEPFFGGGALFFDVQPEVASINDVNRDLIVTYQTIVSNIGGLVATLKEHKELHKLDEEYYNRTRSRWNDGDYDVTPIMRAGAFIYLNKTCFNGLYRVNLDGKFNVPKGKYKNPGICNEKLLREAAVALSGAQIHAGDFVDATNYAVKGDFVYFDPPYVPVSKTANFTTYNEGGFGVTEQAKLADHARVLARRGVNVMLSNSNTQIVRELYEGFHLHEVEAPRAINSKATARGKVKELIITGYKVP